MDYDSGGNEPGLKGEHSETALVSRVSFESADELAGAPRLFWVKARGRYYIKWREGYRQRLLATGTAKLEEAEAAFNYFKRDPEGYVSRPMRWTQPMPERKARTGVIYFVGCKEVRRVKIGFAEDVAKRMPSLQCGSPVTLTLLAVTPGDLTAERAYHDRFYKHRLHGEWFKRVPEIEAEIARLQTAVA